MVVNSTTSSANSHIRLFKDNKNISMRRIEISLWFLGAVLLSVFFTHLVSGEIQRNSDIETWKSQQIPDHGIDVSVSSQDNLPPDQSLWSPQRVDAFSSSFSEPAGDVLGIFEIPRLGLEVPLYDGASELHLNRGIARIEGTGMPGAPGNLGIAGHRDGYFRVLKDIQVGDQLTLSTLAGPQLFVVESLQIVDPSAVEVLDPTDEQSITLVTCFPFYFVGPAPDRFIVHATRRTDPINNNQEKDK